MASITIRKLDDETVVRLKARAVANGRSMEEEARRQLEAANAWERAPPASAVRQAEGQPDHAILMKLERERERLLGPNGKLRPGEATAAYYRRVQNALFGDRVFPDSTPLLRQLRDEDPTAWNGE